MGNQRRGLRRPTGVHIRGYVSFALALAFGLGTLGCGGGGHISLGGSTTSAPTIAPSSGPPTSGTTETRPGAATATTKRPVTITTVPGGPVKLSAADSGSTVALPVGASVELTLAGVTTKWTVVNVNPGGLLTPGPAATQPPHGVLATWRTVRPGTVRLTATGTAWCPPSPRPVACPMWAQPFDVTLVIS